MYLLSDFCDNKIQQDVTTGSNYQKVNQQAPGSEYFFCQMPCST